MKNPAEFAQPLAQKMMLEGYFAGSQTDDFDIDRERLLTHMAEILGMTGIAYEADVNSALILPLDGGKRSLRRFDVLHFSGELTEYSA